MADNPFDDGDVTAQVSPAEQSPEGFTVSFKGHEGYNSDMLVVKSGSADRLKSLLQEAWKAELPNAIALFASKFGTVHLEAGFTPPAKPVSKGYSKPAATAAPASSEGDPDFIHPEPCPECGEKRVKKTVTSKKNGKTYTLWDCGTRGHTAAWPAR